jgi:hypothetical protein
MKKIQLPISCVVEIEIYLPRGKADITRGTMLLTNIERGMVPPAGRRQLFVVPRKQERYHPELRVNCNKGTIPN